MKWDDHFFGTIFMSIFFVGIFFGDPTANAIENPRFEKILDAIEQVESSGRGKNTPDGDNGKAIGPFQIHMAYWRDACQYDITLAESNYERCREPDYARRVVRAYLRRYAKGNLENPEVLARIHNGGGGIMSKNRNGRAWRNTTEYWNKVKQELEEN
jgi:hypothetical protein